MQISVTYRETHTHACSLAKYNLPHSISFQMSRLNANKFSVYLCERNWIKKKIKKQQKKSKKNNRKNQILEQPNDILQRFYEEGR